MDIFINIVVWYCIGYLLSVYIIYLCNIRVEREIATISLNEVLQLSFLSWLLVLIGIVVLTGLDDKYTAMADKLNKKFEGEKI